MLSILTYESSRYKNATEAAEVGIHTYLRRIQCHQQPVDAPAPHLDTKDSKGSDSEGKVIDEKESVNGSCISRRSSAWEIAFSPAGVEEGAPGSFQASGIWNSRPTMGRIRSTWLRQGLDGKLGPWRSRLGNRRDFSDSSFRTRRLPF